MEMDWAGLELSLQTRIAKVALNQSSLFFGTPTSHSRSTNTRVLTVAWTHSHGGVAPKQRHRHFQQADVRAGQPTHTHVRSPLRGDTRMVDVLHTNMTSFSAHRRTQHVKTGTYAHMRKRDETTDWLQVYPFLVQAEWLYVLATLTVYSYGDTTHWLGHSHGRSSTR